MHLCQSTVTVTIADELTSDIHHFEPLLEALEDVLVLNLLVILELFEYLLEYGEQ